MLLFCRPLVRTRAREHFRLRFLVLVFSRHHKPLSGAVDEQSWTNYVRFVTNSQKALRVQPVMATCAGKGSLRLD